MFRAVNHRGLCLKHTELWFEWLDDSVGAAFTTVQSRDESSERLSDLSPKRHYQTLMNESCEHSLCVVQYINSLCLDECTLECTT